MGGGSCSPTSCDGAGAPRGVRYEGGAPGSGAATRNDGSQTMYAVIRAGGKQHRVKAGDVIEIELVRRADSGQLTFSPLLVVDDDGVTHVGKDIAKAQVTAK